MIATFNLLALATALTIVQDTTRTDSVIRLEEVVITGTRAAPTGRLEQASALSVVLATPEQRGASTVAADLLRDTPGVFVQQTSAGQGAVILRGLMGNQVLLLVDGIPLNNGTYRDGPGQYLATIDPETIDRIEVIRGPASVLYGSDAQGGVVNLITRPHLAAKPRSLRVAASGSTANSGYRGRVSGGIENGQWSLGAGGTFASDGDLRAGGGLGRQNPTGFDAIGLDAGLTYRPTRHHSLGAAVQHFRMDDVPRYDRYVTFRAPALGPDAEHRFSPQTRQLAYTRYTFASPSGLVSRLQATLSLAVQREGRSRIKRLDNGTPDSIRTRWRDDVYTPGVGLVGASRLAVRRQTILLTWGGEFYHDHLDSRGYEQVLTSGTETSLTRVTAQGEIPTGSFPNGASADRVGFFLATEAGLTPGLTLEAGARWSRFRNRADVGSAFGGRVENTSANLATQFGLVGAPARAWRVAVRVAEGFRAPNLYDLTRVGPVPGGVALPNPDARPERSLTVDLGLRHLRANSLSAVTIYHMRIRDFIDRVPGSFLGDTLFDGERVFHAANVGTARVIGVEAETHHRWGPLEARATLLYTHGEQDLGDGLEEPMSKIPPLSGSTSLRWLPLGPDLWIEYLLRWATKQDRLGIRDLEDPRIPPGGTPGYAVHSLRVGAGLLSQLSVTGGIENLTDQLYRPHASGVDGAGRHVWVGLSAVGVL